MDNAKRHTLSVVMIVKNESAHLADCLETVSWAVEIVLLDSGSEDDTQAIAERFGAKFHQNTEWPGFGPQRRLAQSYATCDYVLALDADERVTPELRASIETVLAKEDTGIYQLNRENWAFGKKIEHSGWNPDWLARLYPRTQTQYSEAKVHESLMIPEGTTVQKLEGRLVHYTYDQLHDLLRKGRSYVEVWADQKEAAGKKSSLLQAYIHGIGCFLRMYVFRLGFLDGKHGLLLAVVAAHFTWQKYADLWLRGLRKD